MNTPLLDGISKAAAFSFDPNDPRKGTIVGNVAGLSGLGGALGLGAGLLAKRGGKTALIAALVGAGLGSVAGAGAYGIGSAAGWRE